MFCLDVNRDGEQAYAISVDDGGRVDDWHYFARDYADRSWDSGSRESLRFYDDGVQWTAVLRVPFIRLGVVPAFGDTIGFGVDRRLTRDGRVETAAWPDERRVHSWWLRDRVLDPMFFEGVVVGPPARPVSFVSASRGRLSARAAEGENVFSGWFANTGTRPAQVVFEAFRTEGDNSRHGFWKKVGRMDPGDFLPVVFDYPMIGDVDRLTFSAMADGRIIYTHEVNRDFSLPERIHDQGGDFDSKRVLDDPGAFAKSGHLVFPLHLRDTVHLYSYTSLARPYSLEGVLADIAKNRELPYTTIRDDLDYNNLDVRAASFRQHDVRVVFYPNVADRAAGRSGEAGYQVEDRYRYLPTAAFREDYFASLREGLEKYGDMIFGVFVSDELDRMFHRGLEFATAHPDAYPIVRRIDAAVREAFGFGRYGLVWPDTSDADRPYCRIATQRWLNNWIAGFTDDVADRVRDRNPGIRVLGDDPQGAVFPYDYARRWQSVDIVLHQTHDKPLPGDQATSMIVKVVHDLVRKPFWPCVHLSNSGYDLEEMREIMSRAFRNGATGLTVFNGGGDFGTENEIAPDRWAYLNQIARFYAGGNRAALPEQSRVAFLYSNYTSMADYSRGLEAVYNLLGPASDAWFQVIDDCSIERGDIDLSQFDVIFVQFAEYSTPQVVRALNQAVRTGATLVLTTPEAFTRNIDGSALEVGSELRGGVRFSDRVKSGRVVAGNQADGALMNVRHFRVNRAREICGIPEGSSVLFAFEDGTPSVVSVPWGAGRVISFGFNPFWDATDLRVDVTQCPTQPEGLDVVDATQPGPGMEDSAGAFFRALLVYLSVPLDASDIWRLKLPAPERGSSFGVDKGFSLTGNGLVWSLGRPRRVRNVPALGRYRFSVPPVGGTTNWTSFARGRLTDRVTALRERLHREDSVLKWDTGEAVSIDIDFAFSATIRAVELTYEDAIPPLRVLIRDPDGEWREVARTVGETRTRGVHRMAVDGLDVNARNLRLEIAARDGDRKLVVVELDIFGVP